MVCAVTVQKYIPSPKVSILVIGFCLAQLIFVYYSGILADREEDIIIPWLTSRKEQKTSLHWSLPIIYVITPTVQQPTRKADFTRLAQTIRQVPNLHWIVVEDGNELYPCVTNILRRLVPSYTYLAVKTPDFSTTGQSNKNMGILQRNTALEWIRRKYKDNEGARPRGVVYFADDDNVYDLRLFEMMRNIRKVGVWPVPFAGNIMMEKPTVDDSGKLNGFQVYFGSYRKFAVDMAGFAVSLSQVLDVSNATFPIKSRAYMMEPDFISSLGTTFEDVQVLGLDVRTPEGLLEPLVWHTKTCKVNLGEEHLFRKKYGGKASDDGWEV